MTRILLLVLVAGASACAPALRETAFSGASREAGYGAASPARELGKNPRVRKVARLAPPFSASVATRRVDEAAVHEAVEVAVAR
jgi:hypothetical protein